MTNAQMIAGRFLKAQTAKRKLAWIQQQVNSGKIVFLSTHTRVTKITAKHLPQLKATKNGFYVLHGKQWLNHDYSQVSAQ